MASRVNDSFWHKVVSLPKSIVGIGLKFTFIVSVTLQLLIVT